MRVEDRAAALIDEILRPLIEADGGRIDLVRADEQAVVVRLSAACAGCPGAPYTRSHVIEPLLRAELGESVQILVERALVKPT